MASSGPGPWEPLLLVSPELDLKYVHMDGTVGKILSNVYPRNSDIIL
jgi:hypothetical protein